ncbi:MAG: hypothetical protein HY812_21110 [Planctomycetes bacterium]|nr:hypothetical protein [Planctomycetota bacterium]
MSARAVDECGDLVDKWFPGIWNDVLRVARERMRGGRRGHTLSGEDVVQSVYVRLKRRRNPSWRDKSHFVAHAMLTVRGVIYDYDRSRRLLARVPLSSSFPERRPEPVDLLAVRQALERLEEARPRHFKAIMLRLAGWTIPEIAGDLSVAESTVKGYIVKAEGRLQRELRSFGGQR